MAECVTYKHKPNSPEERERIEKAGGHVVFGRVPGSLAVSRALGDSEFRCPETRHRTTLCPASRSSSRTRWAQTCPS